MKLASVIEYKGDNSTFIWKYPEENFNTLSQLVVDESQEAIFYMNGQALDLFGPGRHTLTTQNIPILGKLLNLATGGVTPFKCKVYFINKTEQMAIKWGTSSQVQYMEPTYNFPISIGASGEMTLKVAEGRKLLLKLVGTEDELNQQKLIAMFRGILMTRIKSYIAQVIKEQRISIFEIDAQLEQFSNQLRNRLHPDFSDYGLSLERFYVTTVVKPDGDPQYEKFKELHFREYADIRDAEIRQKTAVINAQTEAQKTIIESQALATKRAQEGYTYQQERGFDVASLVAQNDAVAQFSNVGIGLGTMVGMGGAIGSSIGNAVSGAMGSVHSQEQSVTPTSNVRKCEKCGAPLPENAKFCFECGEKVKPPIPEGMMLCPECGSVVSKGKFCIECGHKLIKICPNCGKEVPDGAKFCLECGEKL